MLTRWLRWIIKHPDIKKWLDDNARVVRFVASRLSLKSFFEFPFTVLVVASVAAALGFAAIIQGYLAHDPLVEADVRIANLLFAFRSVEGTRVFYFLTLFAAPVSGMAVMVFLGVSLFASRQWRTGVLGILGFFGAESVTAVLKLLFHRTRPELFLRAVSEDSFSLPSGHATAAAFVFGFLAYLAFLRFRSKGSRYLIVLTLLVGVLAVDASRLYLGVHYLSDVLAGNAIGLLTLCIIIGLDQWLLARRPQAARPVRDFVIFGAVLVSLMSASALYVLDTSPWTVNERPQRSVIATTDVLNLFESGALPKYTETLIGEAQEPINMILVVPDACLQPDLTKAGWTFASTIEPSSLYRIVKAAFLNDSYLSAPMTPSFYNQRPHDFGFEKPTATQSVRQRHHARFWETPYDTSEGRVMVGTASLDTGGSCWGGYRGFNGGCAAFRSARPWAKLHHGFFLHQRGSRFPHALFL